MGYLIENKKRLLLFVGIVFFQIIFILLIIEFAQMADYTSIDWRIIPGMFIFLCFLADVMLVMSINQMQKRRQAEQRNEIMSRELEEQLKHYDKVIEHLEKMARFRHDFRNYMQTVYALIEREEYDEAKEMLEVLRKNVQEVEL